jgi:class 3 adenylate cyclase/predicted ATPase
VQEPPAHLVPRQPDGERRQITVLFCDLADSARLSSRLDPEDLRAVVQAYQEICAEAIARHEGHLAQYLGDGILAYFGYPAAHEDDARRSVRAGLAIVTTLASSAARFPSGVEVTVRVGIHTGPVVVGTMGAGGHTEQLALGETPNLAARLQGLAAPNTVVISDTTRRLTEGLFAVRSLGEHALKGIPQPVPVYQVERETGAAGRLDVERARGLTPLVGRDHEVALLKARWERVREGAGQVVLLSGEPGIGKSRLLQVVRDDVAGAQTAYLECRCSPYHAHSPLYPVIDLLERACGFMDGDDVGERLGKLSGFLNDAGTGPSDALPLLAALLSLPAPEGAALALSPERQRQQTLDALRALLLGRAERERLVFAVEDLHWADPSTLELLGLLLDDVAAAPVLLLLTCRPEFRPPWPLRSHLVQLSLSRLSPADVGQMARRIVRGEELPAEAIRQVTARTDGVPLFVEELLKMLVETGFLRSEEGRYLWAGSGPDQKLAVPATLQDSLMARLDRLGEAKEIAQLSAVVGRSFTEELLTAVWEGDRGALARGLARLVEAELVHRRGVGGQATYVFKHALIQDAAYQSLLRARRQHYHRRIASVLMEQFPDVAANQPELVAQHYTEAGMAEEAVREWRRAGESDIKRSANAEAVAHLQKGLAVLLTVPDTRERAHEELVLRNTLGAALMATGGWGSADVEANYVRARELCQVVGESPQVIPAIWGLWQFYLVHGPLRASRDLGEQLIALARTMGDPAILLMAHNALGTSLIWFGEHERANEHLDAGFALYDRERHHALALQYSGEDPGVCCAGLGAFPMWCLGHVDQAVRRTNEGLALAERLGHSYSLAEAQTFAAQLYQQCRDVRRTRELSDAALTVSTEQGYAPFVGWAGVLKGWVMTQQGQVEEGIARMRQAMDTWRASGGELLRSYFLGLLAEGHLHARQQEEGLAVIAEALTLVETTDDCYWEAELYRLQGELRLLAENDEGKARACFLRAREIAQRQKARSLELRAAMSLARLGQRQGGKGEADRQLADVYAAFSEGFDTADLQEAKALLTQIGWFPAPK